MNTKSMVDIAQTAKEMTHNVVNVTITMVLLQAPTGREKRLDLPFDRVATVTLVNIVPMWERCLVRNDGC